MPTEFVKKMAEKHGKSLDEVEKLWEEAKQQAAKEDQKDNFAYITTIFKNMVGEKD